MVLAEDWPIGYDSPVFTNREGETEWLYERFRAGRSPVVISGPPGVGKTALLRHFLARVRTTPMVLSPRYAREEAMGEIVAAIDELYVSKNIPKIVAIDNAETFDDEELDLISTRLMNLKRVRMIIFVTRKTPTLTRAKVLHLHPLGQRDARQLLEKLLDNGLSSENMSLALEASAGSPLAIRLLAELARGSDPEQVRRLLRGELYSFDRQIEIPKRRLITEIRPRIILANEVLVDQLRRQPDSIHDLSSRRFEELVAELLSDLGYDVELTPATRDGGKDILAYMNTPLGKVLCLVEAKKYRRDRPVSVGLVRQLYGTLTDANATSAMLVTTSRFSPDAKAFGGRHEYRLSLHDYGSVVRWIEGYGSNRAKGDSHSDCPLFQAGS